MFVQRPVSESPPALFSCEADSVTWGLDGTDYLDQEFRLNIFSRFPNVLALEMARIYKDIWNHGSHRDANLFLLRMSKKTDTSLVNVALSEDAISNLAKVKAIECQKLKRRLEVDDSIHGKSEPDNLKYEKFIYEELARKVERMELSPLKIIGNRTYRSATKRMLCKQWWRKQIRKTSARQFEALAIQLGLVHRRRSVYASRAMYGRFADQHNRNIETLSKLEAINENDETASLLELVESSLSNPRNRRCELMTRLEGMDHLGLQYGHEGLFLTITCPSKYHARRSKSGDENSKYQGFTPRQSQEYLSGVWARIRAELARRKIRFYGFRMVEPHHDGTPHWHLLLFVEKEQANELVEVSRGYAMAEDGSEEGATKHRFTVERIDRTKGTAVGYVAKYISKSIDGFGVDVDLYGKDAKKSAELIVVWARTWGIRQFQSIGGPSVGVWRELRRLKERPEGIMGKAFDAADIGDWAGFVQVMGGPFTTMNDQNVRLAKLSSTDQLTGEIRLNQYMEPACDQVYGVEAGGVSICTREHEWRIQTKPIGDDDLTYRSEQGQVDLQGLTYRSKSGQNSVIRNITGIVPELGPESSGTVGRRVPELGPKSFRAGPESSGTGGRRAPELGPESSRTGPESFENGFRTGFDPLEFCQ